MSPFIFAVEVADPVLLLFIKFPHYAITPTCPFPRVVRSVQSADDTYQIIKKYSFRDTAEELERPDMTVKPSSDILVLNEPDKAVATVGKCHNKHP